MDSSSGNNLSGVPMYACVSQHKFAPLREMCTSVCTQACTMTWERPGSEQAHTHTHIHTHTHVHVHSKHQTLPIARAHTCPKTWFEHLQWRERKTSISSIWVQGLSWSSRLVSILTATCIQHRKLHTHTQCLRTHWGLVTSYLFLHAHAHTACTVTVTCIQPRERAAETVCIHIHESFINMHIQLNIFTTK